MTGEQLTDRKPQPQQCHKCSRMVLAGVDAGIPYAVEPLPLTVDAEMQAIRGGRRTYAIQGDYVTHRSLARIRGDLTRGRPAVLAEHDCADVSETGIAIDAIGEVQRLLRLKHSESMPDGKEFGLLSMLSRSLNAVIIEMKPAPF